MIKVIKSLIKISWFLKKILLQLLVTIFNLAYIMIYISKKVKHIIYLNNTKLLIQN